MQRRSLLKAGPAGVASLSLPGCAGQGDERDAAAGLLRRPINASGVGERGETAKGEEKLRELVRLATLAPSSHNTQCWRFHLSPSLITLAPDFSRRCPVVDPDDHHLHVSLGCAAENLVQAAGALGLRSEVAAGPDQIAFALEPTKAVDTPWARAITQRQCTRGDYDGQPLSSQELGSLERAGQGMGVHVLLITAPPQKERVLEQVLAGDTAQLQSPDFMAELAAWIRFDPAEALRTGDGLYAPASGNPSLPGWLGRRLLPWFMTESADKKRYSRQVRNSAGLAVFVSAANDPAHWFEAGRAYERFALQATALGVRTAFLNQAVEVPATRLALAAALGLGPLERADLVVRFGRGPILPWSLRRPVDAVLV